MPPSLSGTFDKYRKHRRKEIFLTKMDGLIPWQALCAVIESHYPKAGNGQPARGLERTLVQPWQRADTRCNDT
jgi:IS5 family transposase